MLEKLVVHDPHELDMRHAMTKGNMSLSGKWMVRKAGRFGSLVSRDFIPCCSPRPPAPHIPLTLKINYSISRSTNLVEFRELCSISSTKADDRESRKSAQDRTHECTHRPRDRRPADRVFRLCHHTKWIQSSDPLTQKTDRQAMQSISLFAASKKKERIRGKT